jgi:hypothetical protein
MKFLTPAPSALFPEIAENRLTEYYEFIKLGRQSISTETASASRGD